jgi:uncharacterized membrane protein (DUF485 family)
MSLDTFVKIFRRPCQFREFLDQTWMIARVSLIPTLLVAIPFTVLVAFTLNILLREIGAADLSGAGTAFGSITQLGPVVTVLVVAGAGATAICADLGARTIREEIDAMRVLGIDPIQRLVVPRVLASTFVAAAVTGLFTWLAFDSNRHMEAAADRQQRFVDTATQAVVNMFSYNQNSIDESVNRFVNGTSGPLRDMMSQPGNVDNLKALFRDTNATSEAVINGAAMEGKIDEVAQNAAVLVSVRVTVTDLDGVNSPSRPTGCG